MKKRIFIGVIILSLTGCSENTVTGEMLVGDWNCEVISHRFGFKDNQFNLLEAPKKIKDSASTFKYENNILYIDSLKEGGWEESPLLEVYNNETIIKDLDYGIYTTTKSLDKKSHDHFIVTYEYEFISKTPTLSRTNSKIKTESICSRVKN